MCVCVAWRVYMCMVYVCMCVFVCVCVCVCVRGCWGVCKSVLYTRSKSGSRCTNFTILKSLYFSYRLLNLYFEVMVSLVSDNYFASHFIISNTILTSMVALSV